MDESMAHERRSRSLYRSGAEQILENSSLRDGLDQDEAQQLVDWATSQAKTAAYATADFDDDEEAADYVDQRVRTVSRLMRLTTLLTTQRQQYEAEDLADLLAELAQKRADYYGESSTPAISAVIDAAQLQQADNNQDVFTQLFHFVSTPPAASLHLDEEE
jgi:hypothetical protein